VLTPPPQKTQKTAIATTSPCLFLTNGTILKPGYTNPAVKNLQQFLNKDVATQIVKSGPGSPGKEMQKYGPATVSAVKRFQEKYKSEILTPANMKKGTGLFGMATRKKLISLYCTSENGQKNVTTNFNATPALQIPNLPQQNIPVQNIPQIPAQTPPIVQNPVSPQTQTPVIQNNNDNTNQSTTSPIVTATSTNTKGNLAVQQNECIIPSGQSTCTIDLSWNILDTDTPTITQNGVQFSTLPFVLLQARKVSNGTTTFAINDATGTIQTVIVRGRCADATSWNSTLCQ
jgi:hypothetical protein